MIYILDNGEEYSAHEIVFVDCPLEGDDIKAFLVDIRNANGMAGEVNWKLLGSIREAQWEGGFVPTPVADFIDPWWDFIGETFTFSETRVLSCPERLRRWLVAEWQNKNVANYDEFQRVHESQPCSPQA